MKVKTGGQIWADGMKEVWEDEIVLQNFVRKSVEKVPLGRTSAWDCKEQIIQIKEAGTNYMNGIGRLCMKITIISSNTVRNLEPWLPHQMEISWTGFML